MIQKATLDFISDLKVNNTTDWFKAHQVEYKQSRKDFENLVSAIITELSILDGKIKGQALQPKKCMKRINRDIRFSQDKSPYKTNYFALFNPGGYKSEHASYYLHLEPGNSFVGGGVYMPPTPVLNKLRKEIEEQFDEWKAIIHTPTFKRSFPNGIQSPAELKTVPKGFSKESSAIAFLRMKGFYTMQNLTDEEVTSESLLTNIIESYGHMQPVIAFLNRVF